MVQQLIGKLNDLIQDMSNENIAKVGNIETTINLSEGEINNTCSDTDVSFEMNRKTTIGGLVSLYWPSNNEYYPEIIKSESTNGNLDFNHDDVTMNV